VSSSRARFRANLAAQYLALVFGSVWCSGQPCQKHPSTNTATFARGNTRSAVRRIPGRGRRFTKYLRPRAWTSRRTATSDFVSRLRFDRMLARVAAEEAQEPDIYPRVPASLSQTTSRGA